MRAAFLDARPGRPSLPHLQSLFRIAAVALTVGVLDWCSAVLTRDGAGLPTVWLANGFLLGVLLTERGRRNWGACLVASCIANLYASLLGGDPPLTAVLLALFNTVEVLLALAPFFRMPPGAFDPTRPRSLYYFIGCSVMLAPLAAAALAAGVLSAVGSPAPYAHIFWSWAASNGLGIAIMTPLVWAMRSSRHMRGSGVAAALACSGLLTLFTAGTLAIFGQSQLPLLFLAFPLQLVIVYRHGFFGAATSMFLLAVISITRTLENRGPLALMAGATLQQRVLVLQLFLVATLLTGFSFAALLAAREQLERELRRTSLRFREMSIEDELTGLRNRRAFEERFEAEWARAARSSLPVSLLLIDVDYFKKYNDSYGHAQGDQCLRRIAECIRAMLSRPADLAARYGGEEFVVLLPETSLEGAAHVSRLIHHRLALAALPHHGSPYRLCTVSIGAASLVPAAGEERQQLVCEADRALYRAKAAGRNAIELAPGLVDKVLAPS